MASACLRQSSSKAVSSAPPSMPIYLEVLPGIGPRPGSMYPQLPTAEPRPCPQHKRPLDLFCQRTRSVCVKFVASMDMRDIV
ncbi:Forkhead-associated domain containing protein 1 [Dissostichus eleginoides]|uniref:Forkhead-associated domain containing protein 1 n=1 Tax=Dissostichus eleginoides TaxID=100907 RepID=A0AAD9CFZ2_DISEL|nr:Forkhead-associated domain containing protein 1 [Dissostichus eleginoides]